MPCTILMGWFRELCRPKCPKSLTPCLSVYREVESTPFFPMSLMHASIFNNALLVICTNRGPLEKTLNLSSLHIDVDIDVARSRGQTGDGLDVSRQSIPMKVLV